MVETGPESASRHGRRVPGAGLRVAKAQLDAKMESSDVDILAELYMPVP